MMSGRNWFCLVAAMGLVGCGGVDARQDVEETASGGIVPIDPDTEGTSGDAGSDTEDDTAISDSFGGECLMDQDCPDGEVCDDQGFCVSGCSDDKPCEAGLSCCNSECVDLLSSDVNCGSCGEVCDGEMTCVEAQCGMGECAEGTNDCNGDASDGCETTGDCTCAPGETQSCYTAAPDTRDVGTCAAGQQTCNDSGTAWGPCEGEVVPTSEICGNALDDNCNGEADEDVDADGDGFTTCGGDCCDVAGPDCSSPELVNAGAFEVDGNDVDDDCDGMVDNPLPECDAGLASNSNDVFDYARALDLCQVTEESPANPEDAVWGVIEAELLLADDTGSPDPNSRSLRDGFGDNVTAQFGQSLVVLSTGHAADNAGDANPGFNAYQVGIDLGESSGVPAGWLAANGGNLPNAPGCPDPNNATAFNPVNLHLRVRAPTNANSFSVQMFFYSAEYPEYVCTAFNDFFVTLVDSADPENPADTNIAIYDDGAGSTWPVGINLVSAADGLFTACENGGIAQCGTDGTYNGCMGTAELDGTGFDETASACGHTGRAGGGTGWLTVSGNVEPGEIFDVRFIIWDTSDGVWDSTVLLDNWVWSVDASEPGVTPS